MAWKLVRTPGGKTVISALFYDGATGSLTHETLEDSDGSAFAEWSGRSPAMLMTGVTKTYWSAGQPTHLLAEG